MKFALLISVVAVQAVAASPPPEKRVSALILPMDQSSEALTLKVENFSNEALNEFQGITVRNSDTLFGIAVDEEMICDGMYGEVGHDTNVAYESTISG